jgi:AhpD family alkylhydroperoxidase
VYAGLNRTSDRAEAEALAAGVEQGTIDLVKLRASQINGCAFCLDLHTRDALATGESTHRLAVVSAWREANCFSPREEAALELTEAVTEIASSPLDDAAYERIVTVLGEDAYAAVLWVATVINSYNRISILSHRPIGSAS